MHTRKIVGWSMRQTLHTEIALEALTMAVQRQRPASGLIHHGDQGSLGGFNRSTHRGWSGLRGGAGQGPLRAFAKPAFCEAWC